MRGIITLAFLSLIFVSSVIAQTRTSTQVQTQELAGLKLDWQIYPNPFYNTFTVSSQQKDLQIKVFTLSGQQVASTIFRHHDGAKVLYQTGLELSPGIYVVKVSQGQAHRCYKMMKIQAQ